MSDNVKESKAQKLAAARKKLKEYQNRGVETSGTPTASIMTTSSTSIASSERSECEYIGSTMTDNANSNANSGQAASIANYFQVPVEQSTMEQQQFKTNETNIPFSMHEEQNPQQMNAIQLLINEKTQLTVELNRWRNLCHEKDTILEDLRTQSNSENQEFENLKQNLTQQQQSTEQLRNFNAELMHKLSQANAAQEDQSAHLNELQQQLKLVRGQVIELEGKLKEKSKEFELSQLRIQQLSDESSLGKDDRVENFMKNQFMYEQQIRDLQAMVQQFSQDKEQANTQFQNYVQHLNAEIATLSERNSELTDTISQLQDRERQLVEHISQLEKEIQKNLSLRQTAVENHKAPKDGSTSISSNEVEILKKQIVNLEERLKLEKDNYEFERHEFQLKIKSQEDRLDELQKTLNEKEFEVEKISEHLAEQPNQVKLLATMESDKIAASRALAQNVELKKQLDELELRFVQLTNDKAELTNELDREKFENRERRANYAELEQRLQALDEKFQYKDAEMIRLSHENMELTQQNCALQQRIDCLKLLKTKESSNLNRGHNLQQITANNESFEQPENEAESYNDHFRSDHPDNLHENLKINIAKTDSFQEDHEAYIIKSTPLLATEEAVEKLQARFTYLMSQVADLTDEKQRLEHLVLQLQGETETIGEYITLYQTQRRILKQREYEKAAQTRLLQEEREELREKIVQLNELVNKLDLLEKTSLLAKPDIKAELNAALAESVSIEPHVSGDDNESFILDKNAENVGTAKNALPSEILLQIQNIVTEIKENTTKNVSLLDVTTNNAIEICHCCEGQLKIV